jgi:hypothetical protein
MRLYAVIPCFAPRQEVTFTLAEDNAEAMEHGVYVAARDVANHYYQSPCADVFLVGDVTKVGEASARDASPDWPWARGVAAEVDRIEAELFGRDGDAKAETEQLTIPGIDNT